MAKGCLHPVWICWYKKPKKQKTNRQTDKQNCPQRECKSLKQVSGFLGLAGTKDGLHADLCISSKRRTFSTQGLRSYLYNSDLMKISSSNCSFNMLVMRYGSYTCFKIALIGVLSGMAGTWAPWPACEGAVCWLCGPASHRAWTWLAPTGWAGVVHLLALGYCAFLSSI